ncbi:hypothetical protein ACJVC5_02655 [Peredibacter sp. HCB2-198]|uniref:hypothetical protein n=1 Tax=Peredibacter sp. HCB2-198 TaxID=3383025 RepID=UPI0038B48FFD
MNNSLMKLVLTVVINLVASVPLYAQLVEQKQINFPVKTEELMKGDIHYYFSVDNPRKLLKNHPELFDLDSLSLFSEPESMIAVTKAAYVVDRPVGFFDDKQMTDEKYVAYTLGDQKVKKLNPETFKVTVPGDFAHQYKLQIFIDSDDISTLPNSKVIRAVSAAKKMDIISQGASSIMVKEMTQYTKYALGGVTVMSFIPLKENKTLVIQYQLSSVKKAFGSAKIMKPGMVQEISYNRRLIQDYK